MDSTQPQMPALLPTTMAVPPDDFDYGAFLDGDMEFGISDEYLNASGADPDSAPNMSSSSVEFRSSDTAVVSSPQKKLERRGHTKSRRGCFNCKRRRIKCQETQPACGHCRKSGLQCEYPSLPQITHQPQHKIPIFTMEDMRFFQHFLLQCYPHHPLGNENVWTHEVPCLSQTHPYLMHAILGLAACELRKQDPSVLPQAMVHRTKAIRAMKKSIAGLPRRGLTHEQANALISACFALTFQSVLLEDGMPEYMAFIRGIVVVGMQMATRRIRPIFSNIMEEDASALMQPVMEKLAPLPRAWVDGAVAGIENLAPLCGAPDSTATEYHARLLDMAVTLRRSSWEGYQCMKAHYGWWIMLPHERFQLVVDRGSQVMVLLAAHWIALKQIMAEITLHEYDVRQKAPADRDHTEEGMLRWLRHLNGQVDAAHGNYNAWPEWVVQQLDRDLSFFGQRM
ncbi:Sterol uptake control protein 2 like [Verticillium longisporum]|uniref:Sterol uptake control protein 2 like n=2 Tax=Verticillium TaxID=1036719 RepID=A0A8I2ZLN2_VERLO|nr:Sterol uptake control protein 2 like [Verticillium longisporum]PNH41191.1 hypothetical protein VD0004_g5917 [Verticillium dahliae]PNH73606.1 hypothetical protein VD0001_g3961 [Verticillium dahliae]RXG49479.1 hypothetical protein VDGE_06781 [Verticillium dahliae]